MPTIPAKPTESPDGHLTLDELVALKLTVSELDTVAAYQALCGGSILTWATRLGGKAVGQ
jgi:hypothetical protein